MFITVLLEIDICQVIYVYIKRISSYIDVNEMYT